MTYLFKSLFQKDFSLYVVVEGEPLLIHFRNGFFDTDDDKIGKALSVCEDYRKSFIALEDDFSIKLEKVESAEDVVVEIEPEFKKRLERTVKKPAKKGRVNVRKIKKAVKKIK